MYIAMIYNTYIANCLDIVFGDLTLNFATTLNLRMNFNLLALVWMIVLRILKVNNYCKFQTIDYFSVKVAV